MMEKDEVHDDHSATAKVRREEMKEGVQQPKPMDLLRDLLGEDDSIARVRCLVKIFEMVIKLAKVKSEKMLQFIRVENYTRKIFRLCLKPLTAIVANVKSRLENIQFANFIPIKYPGMQQESPSLDNVHVLVGFPAEEADYKQWKMAPIHSSRGKPAVKCRKIPATIPEYRSNSRSRSRQRVFPNNNFGPSLQLEEDNVEDDLDDESDELSSPSSTTGISTLNSDDKARISTLEAQLAQLQSQLQLLMNAQNNQANSDRNSQPDRLPSLVFSSETSSKVSPPPAPPLPPPGFLKPKRLLEISEVRLEAPERPNLSAKVEVVSQKSKNITESRGRPLLMDVLKGIEKVQLRKVERSPNGTPMRGAIESWPTFQKKGNDSLDSGKENLQHVAPSSISEKNTVNSGAFIAMALRRKFANVRLSENFNETDNEEDNNSSSGWDDESTHGIQYQTTF